MSKLQKKAIRLITNIKYIAHTNPLFKRLKLLKIVDISKLRALKLYFNLYNGLLPAYFHVYLDIITREPPRGNYKIFKNTKKKLNYLKK